MDEIEREATVVVAAGPDSVVRSGPLAQKERGMSSTRRSVWSEIGGYTAALVGPPLLTLALVSWGGSDRRNYVFLYLGLVAAIGVLRGLWPALLAATISFALLDYFFTVPYHTFTMSRPEDVVNLVIFIVAASLVGLLASMRRRVLMQSEALARQLHEANTELIRLNKEQAEAAQSAIRIARMEQQVQALRQSERERLDLLANVSHDLRTPISTILAESTADLSSEDSSGRLKVIAAEARRLNALVTDMPDMARIEEHALTLDLRPMHLADSIAAAVERLNRASPARAVRWSMDEADVDVIPDWDRLGQIFDNLFANADHFSPVDTPIRVKVSQETPGYVTVRVVDSGRGVPPELRDRLFSRFFTASPDGSHHHGTGLGLAITRGLVEAHAGTINLEDRSEPGASFRFTLPKAQS